MALMSCKVENSSPPPNISMKASLAAAAASSSLERHSLAGADISSARTPGVAGTRGTFGCIAVDNIDNIVNGYDPVAYRDVV